PRSISSAQALAIVELRRRRLIQARIAASVGVSKSTVGRVLARAGLSRLKDLEPSAPVVRYEHAHPGDLIHIDTKKLGRIERMGKRIPGSSHTPIKAGWEYLFVAIDDHARIGFTDMYPDETKASAVQFLQNTVGYFHSLGVRPKRLLTDNGSAFRSKDFAKACRLLNLKHSFTRPYRPQTNGKAERFIQSALREWAYGIPSNHSTERTAMLERWIHHYNWHRPHQGIKGSAPISRLAQSRNNLLTLHS
ncbi:MAG: IS481 family transposase, partial [bacterium]